MQKVILNILFWAFCPNKISSKDELLQRRLREVGFEKSNEDKRPNFETVTFIQYIFYDAVRFYFRLSHLTRKELIFGSD